MFESQAEARAREISRDRGEDYDALSFEEKVKRNGEGMAQVLAEKHNEHYRLKEKEGI